MSDPPVPGDLAWVIKATNAPEMEGSVVLVTGWDYYTDCQEHCGQWAPWVFVDAEVPARYREKYHTVTMPQKCLMKLSPGDDVKGEVWDEERVNQKIRELMTSE